MVWVVSARPCWFFAAPILGSDGTSLETQLSLSMRVRTFLDVSNATFASLDAVIVSVDSLGKDVWSEPLNRYNVRWSDFVDRNDLGYKSGIEAISKTRALFVQYVSSTDCILFPANQTFPGPFAPTEFVPIPFGRVLGISAVQTADAAKHSPSLLFVLLSTALIGHVLSND